MDLSVPVRLITFLLTENMISSALINEIILKKYIELLE